MKSIFFAATLTAIASSIDLTAYAEAGLEAYHTALLPEFPESPEYESKFGQTLGSDYIEGTSDDILLAQETAIGASSSSNNLEKEIFAQTEALVDHNSTRSNKNKVPATA